MLDTKAVKFLSSDPIWSVNCQNNTSIGLQRVQLTILGRVHKSFSELFDRKYSIFTLMFVISDTFSNDWQVSQKCSSRACSPKVTRFTSG